MNKQHLQIGNLVSLNGQPVQVRTVTRHKVGVLTSNEHTQLSYVHLREIEPIPITKDLILKNGFIMGQDDVLGDIFYEKEIDGCYITIKTDCSNISEYNYVCHIDNADRCTIANADILYVHQLQNLLNLMNIKSDITV